MSDPADPPVPLEVRLAADRLSLQLVWPDGGDDRLTAPLLRAACHCAECTRQRHDGNFPAGFPAVTIGSVEAVGTHALNIRFSDGHGRGIYPWPYLRQLTRTGN